MISPRKDMTSRMRMKSIKLRESYWTYWVKISLTLQMIRVSFFSRWRVDSHHQSWRQRGVVDPFKKGWTTSMDRCVWWDINGMSIYVNGTVLVERRCERQIILHHVSWLFTLVGSYAVIVIVVECFAENRTETTTILDSNPHCQVTKNPELQGSQILRLFKWTLHTHIYIIYTNICKQLYT